MTISRRTIGLRQLLAVVFGRDRESSVQTKRKKHNNLVGRGHGTLGVIGSKWNVICYNIMSSQSAKILRLIAHDDIH